MVFGIFLLEHKRHREKLKDGNTTTQAYQHRTIPSTHGTYQLSATQVGSQPGHCKGIIKDQAKAIRRAHIPLRFGDISILD